MSDVLSGLESMGLGNLSNIELFNDKKQKADEEKKKAEKAKEVKELEEKDLIYLKNVECPCCGKEFKERAIRTSGSGIPSLIRSARASPSRFLYASA